MEKYIVEGGARLCGTVEISGAKNAALAILAATVLAEEPCIIENIPNINDTSVSLKILKDMGATVRLLDKNTVYVDTSVLTSPMVPYEHAKRMRASYYYLGSLLGRYHKADVSMPGGCNLGVRPIDQHIKGFRALGCTVDIVQGGIISAKADELVGSHIYFEISSVGATINVMLAAVKAEGVTILENVAKEPHVVDLANFLNSMGADIRGAGTDVIKIHGVKRLGGTNYTIIPDQIEAGTFMVAAAATGGDVMVSNVIPKHLESISEKLIKAGAVVQEYDDAVRVYRNGPINKVTLKTLPHPGFPTDMQPQMVAMLCAAEGTSVVTESVFENNRFKYVDELSRMGADIQVDGKIAVVEGVPYLKGAPVKATDLRAGAAMVIAGLMAQGVTEIEDIYHIERGYENFVEKLRMLGADIKYINKPDFDIPEAL
ncbi:MAG: UDP-N-acetylglucosamine 1-carboxyvinyltransferase [Oscillospiraceae bacterium]|nr:UDP-N-acetylglucosamine 1-carboxyvinyltransferase [Oscillospiraceae bacterium]